MLGFDALGRLALGQGADQAASNVILVAGTGTYAVTGTAIGLNVGETASAGSFALTAISASFTASLAAAAGAYALTGVSASSAIGETAAVGSYSLTGTTASFMTSFASVTGAYNLTGIAATFGPQLASTSGSYVLAGYAASEPIVGIAAGGAYAITPVPTPLIRTGGDIDQVYGGIGHYLEQIEQAKQLARITRKTPAPIVHEIRPQLQPPASPPIAPQPPAVDRGAIAAQRLAEQQAAQARILKRRRQEAEILLLAS
jgi:hypothetical protein